MPEVALGIVTKNALRRLKPRLLRLVLASSLQVPYSLAIVIDDGTDATGQFIKSYLAQYGRDVVVARSPADTRPSARQAAIDLFFQLTTGKGYLMFMDDDIILRKGWWEEASRLLNMPGVGEVWGIAYDVGDRPYYRAFAKSQVEYLVKAFYARGGTHDTVYRAEALRGIEIPGWCIIEDAFIHHYVNCRGFKSAVNTIGGLHLNPPMGRFKELLQMAYAKVRLLVEYGFDTDIEATAPIGEEYRALAEVNPLVALGYVTYAHVLKPIIRALTGPGKCRRLTHPEPNKHRQ